MKINDRGFWENDTTEGHGHDENLAWGLLDFIINDSRDYSPDYGDAIFLPTIIDIGCGDGFYTKFLRDNGIDCEGYDGNPFTKEITNGECKVVDFSVNEANKLTDFETYNWALSLEVGEHIPEEYEQTFLNNIISFCPNTIILSWAIPGQGGDGHVNLRSNEYIIKEMEKRNYILDLNATNNLRSCASEYPRVGYWFKNTIMIFRSK